MVKTMYTKRLKAAEYIVHFNGVCRLHEIDTVHPTYEAAEAYAEKLVAKAQDNQPSKSCTYAITHVIKVKALRGRPMSRALRNSIRAMEAR